MTDVHRILGPGGAPDSSKKDKTSADTDKFKDLMKIQKVGETDAEARKKRKRSEEEEAPKEEEGAPSEPSVSGESIFSPQQSQLAAAPFTTGEPSPPSVAPPSPPATPEESMWEEESLLESLPPSPASAAPPPQASTERMEEPLNTPSEEAAESSSSLEKKDENPHKEPLPYIAPQEKMHKEEVPTYNLDKDKTLLEEEEALFETAPPPSIVPKTSLASSEEKGKEKVPPSSELGAEMLTQLPSLAPSEPLLSSAPPPPFTFLSPQVLALFERMVGVITVMNTSGIKETTINLTNPQFASSVFYGSQIIIREFSTAPYTLNVEIHTSSQGMALIQGSRNDLLAAFQTGNYNFRIHRLETSLIKGEKPLVRRKESAGEENKEELS